MPATPAQTAIERLLKRGRARVFVDTCFLLHDKGWATLEDGVWDSLHAKECTVVVPYPVIHELLKHSGSSTDQALAEKSKSILTHLAKRQEKGQVRLMGTKDDKFADQTFLEVFTRFRPKYDLLLFTNDRGLCRDLLRLNDTESTSRCTNEVWVAWHTGRHFLAAKHTRDLADTRTTRSKSSASSPPRPEPLFGLFDKPRALDTRLVGGTEKLKAGQSVRVEGGSAIRLGSSIASGGEGEIFALDKDHVAKIYFPDRRTSWRAAKLALMCGKKVSAPNVNWPSARLFDSADRFVGYVMPLAKGIPLQHAVFGKASLEEHFPRWNRLHLTTLARTVAETVHSLNHIGVLVGDINPMNFIVSGDSSLRLVDVDSVQVGDFPCPVGMLNFRAPEITQASYDSFLRNEHHEAFALATMLFMILMGGKPPFSFQGGGDPAENIRNGNFPYATDHGLIPAGAYRYIWSFFPYKIKKAFEHAFVTKSPAARPSAFDWIQLLDEYCKDLRKGKVKGAIDLWPSTFRPRDDKSLVQLRCAECETVFQAPQADAAKRRKYPRILCNTCITVLNLAKQAGSNHTCTKCGKLFSANFHQVQKHEKVLEVCDSCVAHAADQPRKCKECGRTFALENGEVRYLLANGLNLPKRCGPCRGKPDVKPPKPKRTPKTYSMSSGSTKETSIWEKLMSLFE